MALVDIVKTACREQMKEIADRICADYKKSVDGAIQNKATSTGQAVASIHVEQVSETKYRIGSNHLHL